MEAIINALQNDRLQKLSVGHIPTLSVSIVLARHITQLLRRCTKLLEIDVSLSHIALDALRVLLQGASLCPSVAKIHLTGGYSMIQAKVVSSALASFLIQGHACPVIGVHIILEPSTFNDIAATILYDGLDRSTRIVDVAVRSSVSNANVLTVIPRFRRRVQSILKRNRRSVALSLPAPSPIDLGHVMVATPRKPSSPHFGIGDGAAAFGHVSPPPCIPQGPRNQHQQHGENTFRVRGARDSDSLTPSPTMPCPPDPARFRDSDGWVDTRGAPARAEDGRTTGNLNAVRPPSHEGINEIFTPRNILSHSSHHTQHQPPALFEPHPPQQKTTPVENGGFGFTNHSDGQMPFQRHVILEFASMKSILQQQCRDVELIKLLVQSVTEETALQWNFIRDALDTMKAARGQCQQHHQLQQQGMPSPKPPTMPPPVVQGQAYAIHANRRPPSNGVNGSTPFQRRGMRDGRNG